MTEQYQTKQTNEVGESTIEISDPHSTAAACTNCCVPMQTTLLVHAAARTNSMSVTNNKRALTLVRRFKGGNSAMYPVDLAVNQLQEKTKIATFNLNQELQHRSAAR